MSVLTVGRDTWTHSSSWTHFILGDGVSSPAPAPPLLRPHFLLPQTWMENLQVQYKRTEKLWSHQAN